MRTIEHAILPDGIELKRTKHGFIGIFAKRDFSKGTDVYSNIFRVIPESADIVLVTPIGEIQIDVKVHSVKQNNGFRDYYGFDSFMNHHCEANTISIVKPGDEDTNRYYNHAVKDIHAGDEITANYLFFDWDCDGHSFDCVCGAASCFGHIGGFKDLDFETQLKYLADVDDGTLKKFVAATRAKLEKLKLPDRLKSRIRSVA